jgi:anti-anti-sigma factor
MPLLEVREDLRDDAVVLSVAGEIDSATIDTLVFHLDAALDVVSDRPGRVLVIELDGVTYFGSAGLNAVLGCYERGNADGVAVRVVASNAEVIRPIQVTKLDGVLRPFRTVAGAVQGADE